MDKSLGINSSHISYTSENSHILEIYIKICIFSNINQKFTCNTKMNKMENKKVKPKCMYENDMIKG